jgi:hypothetical protein
MPIATATSTQPSKGLTRAPSVVLVARPKRKVPPPPERLWAVYKPPPWWTIVLAFVLSVAIHLGAVAALETGPDGRVARLWESRVLAGPN